MENYKSGLKDGGSGGKLSNPVNPRSSITDTPVKNVVQDSPRLKSEGDGGAKKDKTKGL